jgi:hypothetical protein
MPAHAHLVRGGELLRRGRERRIVTVGKDQIAAAPARSQSPGRSRPQLRSPPRCGPANLSDVEPFRGGAAPENRQIAGSNPTTTVAAKVAGRRRCHEEATRTASAPTEPHGPRRCGGPEHSAGLSNALELPGRWRLAGRHLFVIAENRRGTKLTQRLKKSTAKISPKSRFGRAGVQYGPNRFAARQRPVPPDCGHRVWRGKAPGRRA